MMQSNSVSKHSVADLHSGRPILNVVAAEINFGIFSCRDYRGIAIIGGQYRMVFTARFHNFPVGGSYFILSTIYSRT
jgi:hypothetical protein